MSIECTFFVERRERDGTWAAVELRALLVARRARKLHPSGALLPEHLVEAEGAMILAGERLPEGGEFRDPWGLTLRHFPWAVPPQNAYALFDRLAGAGRKQVAADKPIAPPRGLPADLSEGVRPWVGGVPLGRFDPGDDSTPSWLTLRELYPLRMDPRFKSFDERVLRPMAWAVPSGVANYVRAVFYFHH